MSNLYIIKDLNSARNYFAACENKVIITNAPGSASYYGMLVIDYIIQSLKKDFSNNIEDVIIDVGSDHDALFTAIKLKYRNIVYTGNSQAAKQMLKNIDSFQANTAI